MPTNGTIKASHLAPVLLGSAFIATLFTGHLIAHPDDPKVRDTQPRYEGPGYRRDVNGLNPGPEFPSEGMTLLSWLPVPEFGNHSWANDCWGYTSPSGREYAIIGLSDGTGFVEVTNPGNAQIIGVIDGPNSTWRDVKVYDEYAYAVSEGGSGIQVIDLRQIDQGSVTLANTVTTGGTQATHNVALNEDSGFLYRTGGGSNGLRIYDLSNPATPVFVASWSDRYVHDAQIVTYTDGPYAGREIAFCCAGFNGGWEMTGLTILDVTDKSNLIELAHLEYSTGSYSHQGWLSPDKQYFYLGDELDEDSFGFPTRTRVIDVSDLNNPVEVNWYTNGNSAVDHNLYTKDNLIFAANYTSGLRVFDATNPVEPVEVAYFDTHPNNDATSFNGLWSNYPYFQSGIIIGSDRERGLFVVELGLPLLTFEFPDGRPSIVHPSGTTSLTVRVIAGEGEPNQNAITLHVDSGDGFAAVPMSPLGSGLYSAAFPPASCDDIIRYYVSAETTKGEPVVEPRNAPDVFFEAAVASGSMIAFADNFESNLGWTVSGDAADGHWNRGVPVGGGDRGDPPTDGDGSGQCYLTDNVDGNSDVDDGTTILTSPTFDATGGNAFVSYWRWYSNNSGSNPSQDIFEVELSNDNGQSWVTLEIVGPAGTEAGGGWYYKTFRIADTITPTDEMRIRFIASDLGGGSVVEAGVDGVSIDVLTCGSTELVNFTMQFGQVISGGLDELLESDNQFLRARSRFGFTALEPNIVQLTFRGETTVTSPSELALRIESRINHPVGSAQVRLRNWNTNQLTLIDQYGLSNTESVYTNQVPSAEPYVSPTGAIDLNVKHVVVAVFTALGFDSYFDEVNLQAN